MSGRTSIEWTDSTWNPVGGCTKVSPGCDNCYAERIADRFKGTRAWPNGFDVTLRPNLLRRPLSWRQPRRIFVNSMSDLFHADIPDDYVAQVFAVMLAAPWHTFQVLTKRHGRLRALMGSEKFEETVRTHWVGPRWHPLDEGWWPPQNVLLGVSVEDQQWANLRIPVLLSTSAAQRFLSCEPLLGPLDVSPWLPWLDWVIVGGESGPGARPVDPEWVRDIRDQCVTAGVPFFFKQWGGLRPKSQGRDLDGRTWDGFPERVR